MPERSPSGGMEPSAAKEREHALFDAARNYLTEVVPTGNDVDELRAYHALAAALDAYDSWCPLHGGFDPDQRGPGLCPYCVAADRLPGPAKTCVECGEPMGSDTSTRDGRPCHAPACPRNYPPEVANAMRLNRGIAPVPAAVSLADTIRRNRVTIISGLNWYAGEGKACAANATAALEWLDALVDLNAAYVDQRERDRQRIRDLTEALAFYAEPESWNRPSMGDHSDATRDGGEIARDVLVPFPLLAAGEEDTP